MTTSAAIREAPIESVLDIPDPVGMKPVGPWTIDGLRAALRQLCIRYDLPNPDELNWEWLGDPESEPFQETAPKLYLAASALCALRTSSASPAVAFGAWSTTDLAAHLRGAVPPRSFGRDIFPEPASAPTGPVDHPPMSAPIVLVGELPEAGTFDALMCDPLLSNPRIDHQVGGVAMLRAGLKTQCLSGGPDDPGELAADHSPTECSVEIRAGHLLRALGHGLDLLERETGARFSPGESLGSTFGRHAAPGPAWPAVVPELPAWARTAEAFGSNQADTFALWQALIPAQPTPATEAALRARACLAHQLFILTEISPALGWAALMAGTDDPGAVVGAAREAGIRVLPPTVQSASTTWENDAAPSVLGLRAPLRIIEDIASTADQIALSFRLQGPFASVPDLVRRIPAIAADPRILRRLLEVGSLDALCDRELVLMNWSVVSEWCSVAFDPAIAAPLVADVPLFAVPSHSDVDPSEMGDWWDRLVTGKPSSPTPDPISFTAGEGAVELRATAASARRAWRIDGENFIVLALQTGAQSVHAVIATSDDRESMSRSITLHGAKQTANGAPAVWIDTALVSAPVSEMEVLVPLLGDRDRDLERLRRLQAILRRHPGDLPVRLALIHGESRRDLPRSDDNKVAWSVELADDLEVLLGPNSVRLTEGD
jgi:hypothetical protein